jgi:hypothetical protein
MTRDTLLLNCRGMVAALGLAATLAVDVAASRAQAPALSPPAATAALPEPIHWTQDVFLIPYQWSPGAYVTAQSVRLLISQDRGATWHVISEAKPHVKAFNYRAPGDGEYWFAVRTIDAQGRAWPQGPYHPELRVIVEQGNKPGERAAPPATANHGPPTPFAPVTNPIQAQSPSTSAWTSAPPRSAAADVDAADHGPETAAQPWPAAAAVPYRLFDSSTGIPTDEATRYGNPVGVGRYAERPDVAPLEPFRQAALRRLPEIGESTEHGAESRGLGANESGRERKVTHLPISISGPSSKLGTSLPPGIEPRRVNARRFALEYELADVGSSGVSRVELWGTRDGGQSWRRFAQDDDVQSPIQVTVEGEGLYGFLILAESGGGMPAAPPQSGDRPELWVEVDLHRPFAELTSVERGTGNQSDHLLLRWQADDENLRPRPISLFYSSRPAGPWSVIAADLENTGEYAWRVERHVPERCYLRLEARDLAGNRGAYQTLEPVTLAQPEPSVKLRTADER